MKVIYSFYRILDTIYSFQTFLFIENIKQQLFHPGVSLTKLISDIPQLLVKITEYNQSTIKVQSIEKPKRDILFFVFCFFYQGFLSHTLAFNRTAGEGEGRGSFLFHSSIPLTQEHLDIYFVEMSNAYF